MSSPTNALAAEPTTSSSGSHSPRQPVEFAPPKVPVVGAAQMSPSQQEEQQEREPSRVASGAEDGVTSGSEVYHGQEATEMGDHVGHLAQRSDANMYQHPNHSATSTTPPSSWVARLAGRNRSSSVDSPPPSHFTFPARLRAAGGFEASGQPAPQNVGLVEHAQQRGQPQIVVSSSSSSSCTPSQPRNRLSFSRLSITRPSKGNDSSRQTRPPSSSGVAQSSLNHPYNSHSLQRTYSVNEMRTDAVDSSENLPAEGGPSTVDKNGGRRKLFSRNSNMSAPGFRGHERHAVEQGPQDKPLPPPSASGKARQILKYLDSGGARGTQSQREWDLNSIKGSNVSSDTLASTTTADVRRRSGESTFASSVTGSIPAWARRMGKANKGSASSGAVAGSPGTASASSSLVMNTMRSARGDREVSPAFSDDSNAPDGRSGPSASTHSGSESAGAHSHSGRIPTVPSSQAAAYAASPQPARPSSSGVPASSSTSRFSLPIPGGTGLERAFRFFMDPDASSSSIGKGGATEQQGIWLLGVWHGPETAPLTSDVDDLASSKPSPHTPTSTSHSAPSGDQYATATRSPSASIKRGSISSQSRSSEAQGFRRNPSSDALHSPGTSAPSSFSARSSPEKVHTRLPPASSSSGSISNRSSIDNASGSSIAPSRKRPHSQRREQGGISRTAGSRKVPAPGRTSSREGSMSASGTDAEVATSQRHDRQSSPSPALPSAAGPQSPPTPQSAARLERQAAIAIAQATISGTRPPPQPRSTSDLSKSEASMNWQAQFQADFSSRIWCTYRNHFTPIARDGTISVQAEAGPVQAHAGGASGDAVTPATPLAAAAGATPSAWTSTPSAGPGQSVRQWLGRKLGEGGSSLDLLSVSPSQTQTQQGFQAGTALTSPTMSHFPSSSSSVTMSSPYSKSPSTGGGTFFGVGGGGGLLSTTTSVAGGLGEKMGIPNLWGRATAAAQAVGLAGRGGLTTDAGWGCMLRTGQSLLANALMDVHLGREWRRKDNAVAQRVGVLQQSMPGYGSPGQVGVSPLSLHSSPEASLLDPYDADLETKRQALEAQWRTAKAEYAKYVRLISWFLDDPCLACPFSVHRMAREGKRLGKEVGEWFGPSTAAGAIKQLVGEFPDAGLGVCLAVDQVVYLTDVKAAAQDRRRDEPGTPASVHRWDRPVLILINIRLGIDCVHPRYYNSVKNIFTFPQSVGISGGRPSSSYYFMGCQDNTLFYLDPHNVRPAVPYQPPPPSVQQHSSSQTPATPQAKPASLSDQEPWQDDWWCQAYSDAQLSTFHCDKIRKMPMKSLDPSMLVGFLIKTSDELSDFCARVKSLPEPIFSVAENAPRWDAVDDDDELDAAMESFSESSIDPHEDTSEGDDSDAEDDEEEVGFDSGAVKIHDPVSIPEVGALKAPSTSTRLVGSSSRTRQRTRSPLAANNNIAPIQFPSMKSDDLDAGDDAQDESTTVGHDAYGPGRRRLSSARKSTTRRISGLGRRRVQRQSNDTPNLAHSASHSAFGPPGRYGSGISSRQTSGASTAREFSFSMPVPRASDGPTLAAAAGTSSGANTEISPSASTERGDYSVHDKMSSHPSEGAIGSTAEEPESSGESGFGRMREDEDGVGETSYVVTQAGSLSSDDADSTWSNVSGVPMPSPAAEGRLGAAADGGEQVGQAREDEEEDDDDDDELVEPPMPLRSSSYELEPSSRSKVLPLPPAHRQDEMAEPIRESERRYAIVSVDSEEKRDREGEGGGGGMPPASGYASGEASAELGQHHLSLGRRAAQHSSGSNTSSGGTPSVLD